MSHSYSFAGKLSSTAAALAHLAHAGQVDKQNQDYYQHHVARVAKIGAVICDELGLDAQKTDELVASCWLHDMVEDTHWELAHMEQHFPDSVVLAVDNVTRREGETYKQLIERAASHQDSAIVKLADNTINIASGLYKPPADETLAAMFENMRNKRYLPARKKLTIAAGVNEQIDKQLLEFAGKLLHGQV